jgi:hypothetical protein
MRGSSSAVRMYRAVKGQGQDEWDQRSADEKAGEGIMGEGAEVALTSNRPAGTFTRRARAE